MKTRIIGSGSCIPELKVTNRDFGSHTFVDHRGVALAHTSERIIEKFAAITGIEERRYAAKGMVTSDLAYNAALKAIADAGIDPETIDYIICAHNFGDVQHNKVQGDTIPSLASRVKHLLKIRNPRCIAYDLIFGCPGWIEGVIQSHAFIRSGMARRCLVIEAESLSRVVDHSDRDSMIYADGAGAALLEAGEGPSGLLCHESASYTFEESGFLYFGPSYDVQHKDDTRYIKMHGRKIYEFALKHVPLAMQSCLRKGDIPIGDIKKIIIHQANEKMDEAILERFYNLYGYTPPLEVMPMSIRTLGNSSVATVPTLYDLIAKGQLEGHNFAKNDIILFASVGAGMNINAFAYRI